MKLLQGRCGRQFFQQGPRVTRQAIIRMRAVGGEVARRTRGTLDQGKHDR